MVRQVPGLGLSGYWPYGTDGWNTGMDANLRLLSVVAGARVVSRTQALPASPAPLSLYIVPTGSTNGDLIAIWDGPSGSEAWVYITPQPGWHFYVQDEQLNVQWTGASWVQFAAGSAGGGSVFGSQIYLHGQQNAAQTIDTTTDTLVFGNITEDTDDIFSAADNTIRIPEAQEGRTAVIVCNTRHTTDGAGVVETVLERSTDAGATWSPIAYSSDSSEYFGVTTLTAIVSFLGGEWYRFRHTTAENKTTSGDERTAFTLTTVGAGQIGRIVRTTTTRNVSNPQWNAGDFTGWTVFTSAGTLKIYIPPDREGDHALHPLGYNYIGLQSDTGGPWYVEQVVDVPDDPDSVTVSWDQHTRLVEDQIRLEVDFLDSGLNQIGQYIGPGFVNSAIQLWETFTDTATVVPSGTRFARVRLRTVVTAGSQQLNLTNFVVRATTLGVSGMLPGSVYAFLPSLAGNALRVLRVNATGDGVEWGRVPFRIRNSNGLVDQADSDGIHFVDSDVLVNQNGETIEIELAGIPLHGVSGQIVDKIKKLTITGAGVGVTQPLAGEIEITIPGPGEAVPAATAIEEIDGFGVNRGVMSPAQNGQPLVWDHASNQFVPLPEGFSPISYGGGVTILRAVNLAGLRNVILTDAADQLDQYDELHMVLRNSNDHADVAISTDGGSTWDTVFAAFSGSGSTSEGTGSDDSFRLGGWASDVDLQIATGILRFFSRSGFPTTWQMFGANPGTSGEHHQWGYSAQPNRHNAVIIQRDSAGNFTGGQLYVLGVKKTRQPVDITARVENGAVLSGGQELLFHETMGVRLDQGVVGRLRVNPAANTDATFQIVDRAGAVVQEVTVLAGQTEAQIEMAVSATITDTVRLLAPATPDAAITDVFVATRAEAAR